MSAFLSFGVDETNNNNNRTSNTNTVNNNNNNNLNSIRAINANLSSRLYHGQERVLVVHLSADPPIPKNKPWTASTPSTAAGGSNGQPSVSQVEFVMQQVRSMLPALCNFLYLSHARSEYGIIYIGKRMVTTTTTTTTTTAASTAGSNDIANAGNSTSNAPTPSGQQQPPVPSTSSQDSAEKTTTTTTTKKMGAFPSAAVSLEMKQKLVRYFQSEVWPPLQCDLLESTAPVSAMQSAGSEANLAQLEIDALEKIENNKNKNRSNNNNNNESTANNNDQQHVRGPSETSTAPCSPATPKHENQVSNNNNNNGNGDESTSDGATTSSFQNTASNNLLGTSRQNTNASTAGEKITFSVTTTSNNRYRSRLKFNALIAEKVVYGQSNDSNCNANPYSSDSCGRYFKITLQNIERLHFDTTKVDALHDRARWEERRLYIRVLDSLNSKVQSYDEYETAFREACLYMLSQQHASLFIDTPLTGAGGGLGAGSGHFPGMVNFSNSSNNNNNMMWMSATPTTANAGGGGNTEQRKLMMLLNQNQQYQQFGNMNGSKASPNGDDEDGGGGGDEGGFWDASVDALDWESFPVSFKKATTKLLPEVEKLVTVHPKRSAKLAPLALTSSSASSSSVTKSNINDGNDADTNNNNNNNNRTNVGDDDDDDDEEEEEEEEQDEAEKQNPNDDDEEEEEDENDENDERKEKKTKSKRKGRRFSGSASATSPLGDSLGDQVSETSSNSNNTRYSSKQDRIVCNFATDSYLDYGKIMMQPESSTLDYKSYVSNAADAILERTINFMTGFLNAHGRGRLAVGVLEILAPPPPNSDAAPVEFNGKPLVDQVAYGVDLSEAEMKMLGATITNQCARCVPPIPPSIIHINAVPMRMSKVATNLSPVSPNSLQYQQLLKTASKWPNSNNGSPMLGPAPSARIFGENDLVQPLVVMYDMSWSWKDNFRAKHNTLMRILKKYDLGLVFLPNFPVPLDYSVAANTVPTPAPLNPIEAKKLAKKMNKENNDDDDDFGGGGSGFRGKGMFPNVPSVAMSPSSLYSPAVATPMVAVASGNMASATISPSSTSTTATTQQQQQQQQLLPRQMNATSRFSANSQYDVSPLQNIVDPIPASAAAFVYKIIPLNANGETLLREFAEAYAGAKDIQNQQKLSGGATPSSTANTTNAATSQQQQHNKPAPILDPVELAREDRRVRAKTIVAVEYNIKSNWHPYDPEHTENVISAWIDGTPAYSYVGHSATYVVDLVRFTQSNQKTGTKRSIRFLFRRPFSFSEREAATTSTGRKMPNWVAETLDDLEKITKGNRQHCIVAAAGVALPQLYLVDISVDISRLPAYHPLRVNYSTGKFFSDWPTIPLWDPITQAITRVERDYTLPLVEERKRALHRQTERLATWREKMNSINNNNNNNGDGNDVEGGALKKKSQCSNAVGDREEEQLYQSKIFSNSKLGELCLKNIAKRWRRMIVGGSPTKRQQPGNFPNVSFASSTNNNNNIAKSVTVKTPTSGKNTTMTPTAASSAFSAAGNAKNTASNPSRTPTLAATSSAPPNNTTSTIGASASRKQQQQLQIYQLRHHRDEAASILFEIDGVTRRILKCLDSLDRRSTRLVSQSFNDAYRISKGRDIIAMLLNRPQFAAYFANQRAIMPLPAMQHTVSIIQRHLSRIRQHTRVSLRQRQREQEQMDLTRQEQESFMLVNESEKRARLEEIERQRANRPSLYQLMTSASVPSVIPLQLCWLFERGGSLPAPYPFIPVPLSMHHTSSRSVRPAPHLIPLYFFQEPVFIGRNNNHNHSNNNNNNYSNNNANGYGNNPHNHLQDVSGMMMMMRQNNNNYNNNFFMTGGRGSFQVAVVLDALDGYVKIVCPNTSTGNNNNNSEHQPDFTLRTITGAKLVRCPAHENSNIFGVSFATISADSLELFHITSFQQQVELKRFTTELRRRKSCVFGVNNNNNVSTPTKLQKQPQQQQTENNTNNNNSTTTNSSMKNNNNMYEGNSNICNTGYDTPPSAIDLSKFKLANNNNNNNRPPRVHVDPIITSNNNDEDAAECSPTKAFLLHRADSNLVMRMNSSHPTNTNYSLPTHHNNNNHNNNNNNHNNAFDDNSQVILEMSINENNINNNNNITVSQEQREAYKKYVTEMQKQRETNNDNDNVHNFSTNTTSSTLNNQQDLRQGLFPSVMVVPPPSSPSADPNNQNTQYSPLLFNFNNNNNNNNGNAQQEQSSPKPWKLKSLLIWLQIASSDPLARFCDAAANLRGVGTGGNGASNLNSNNNINNNGDDEFYFNNSTTNNQSGTGNTSARMKRAVPELFGHGSTFAFVCDKDCVCSLHDKHPSSISSSGNGLHQQNQYQRPPRFQYYNVASGSTYNSFEAMSPCTAINLGGVATFDCELHRAEQDWAGFC